MKRAFLIDCCVFIAHYHCIHTMLWCCCCFRKGSSTCTEEESRKSQLQLLDRVSCVVDQITSLRSIHASNATTSKLFVSKDDVVRALNSLTVPCPHSHTSACNACLLLRMSAYEDCSSACASIETQCVLQLAWEVLVERRTM